MGKYFKEPSHKMTVKRKKDKITYNYDGNLEATFENSKKELEKKSESQERVFLLWQYQKAKKAHEAYERRINDLKGFIELAEKELKKRESAEE